MYAFTMPKMLRSRRKVKTQPVRAYFSQIEAIRRSGIASSDCIERWHESHRRLVAAIQDGRFKGEMPREAVA
jgi:hypothetical protein